MADKYAGFSELAQQEIADKDFSLRCTRRLGVPAVIAPHGGGIEPGTSELAEAIAGNDLSFYAFEGKKAAGNGDLHITSTRFDEPRCLELLAASPTCIAMHGEGTQNREAVFLGGLNHVIRDRIAVSLKHAGFIAEIHGDPMLQGCAPSNVCNRCVSRRGVQLEVSAGLRRSFFLDLSTKQGREGRTQPFEEFVHTVREAILRPDGI